MATVTPGMLALRRPVMSRFYLPSLPSASNVSQLIHKAKSLPLRLPFPHAAIWAIGVSSIIAELWESILRAVPKKKTSYSKKRSRFLAGKALKDVHSLNKCSACGNIKRAHLLCPFCVGEIRSKWKQDLEKPAEAK